MQKIILITLLLHLQCSIASAQAWNPLNIYSLNLYEDITTSFPRYPLIFAFANQEVQGGEIRFSGHLRDSGEVPDSIVTCVPNYWIARKLTHAWFGSRVITNGTSIRIGQLSLDTLYFDIAAGVGDTLWILNDSVKIYGVCNSHQQETILGYTDEVLRFTLKYTTPNGTPIVNSTIHGKEFLLGKDLGFINYFNLYPDGTPGNILTMIGNQDLDAGKHSFKYSDCFVFPVGSSYQIRESTFMGGTGPSSFNTEYVKSDITNIVETAGAFQVTRDVHTLTIDVNSNETNVYETGIVNSRPKSELITSYLVDPTSYYSATLTRAIFCGDTVFRIRNWPSLVDVVCTSDSIITYFEIDPLGSSYWQDMLQFECLISGASPNQAGNTISPYILQSLQYLNTPDCNVGFPWYVELDENAIEPPLDFNEVGNSLYKFGGFYEDVSVFTIDGKSIENQGSFTFPLMPSTIYLVQLTIGNQRSVRKISILE